mmetsp:Transcript_28618/g.67503  ORF Transcript_28618/g.67503 Transcript_28618/m.67503 type:complete len:209 (-) Transcript_28618:116-742(-)
MHRGGAAGDHGQLVGGHGHRARPVELGHGSDGGSRAARLVEGARLLAGSRRLLTASGDGHRLLHRRDPCHAHRHHGGGWLTRDGRPGAHVLPALRGPELRGVHPRPARGQGRAQGGGEGRWPRRPSRPGGGAAGGDPSRVARTVGRLPAGGPLRRRAGARTDARAAARHAGHPQRRLRAVPVGGGAVPGRGGRSLRRGQGDRQRCRRL